MILALLVAFAPAPYLPKKPPATIEGEWDQVDACASIKGEPGGAYSIRIGGGKWVFTRAAGPDGKRAINEYFLALDPKAKPAAFDLRKALADPNPYGRGIWRLEGGMLHVAYGWSGERPTEFEPKIGYWIRLRRSK